MYSLFPWLLSLFSFQVRTDSLEKVVRECKKEATFETYAAGIFAPALADHGMFIWVCTTDLHAVKMFTHYVEKFCLVDRRQISLALVILL